MLFSLVLIFVLSFLWFIVWTGLFLMCLYLLCFFFFFFFKQKTAYEMRISDWSSDVCSSDLHVSAHDGAGVVAPGIQPQSHCRHSRGDQVDSASRRHAGPAAKPHGGLRVGAGPAAGMGAVPRPVAVLRRRHLKRPETGRASCRERVCQTV